MVGPSTPHDAKGLLLAALRDPDPVLFMEPKRIYRSFREKLPDERFEVPIGEAAIRRKDEEITVILWSAMMEPTLAAVEPLGVYAEVIDCGPSQQGTTEL